jgi:hypothetical protein
VLGAFRTQTCSKVLFEDGDRVQGGSDKTFTSKFNFTVYMIHSLCFKIRIMSEFHQGHCHRSMLLHNKAPGPLAQPRLEFKAMRKINSYSFELYWIFSPDLPWRH